MQPVLAPSLDIKGAVLTGWVGSMEMPALKMREYDGRAPLYLAFLPTYAAIDPNFRPEYILSPAGRAVYEGLRTTCGLASILKFRADKPVTNSLFVSDTNPLETRAQPYRAYPPLAFKSPVFLGVGLKDEQTAPRSAFDGAKRACALGSNIAINFYPGLMHSPTVLRSQEDSTPWVRAAFSGKAPPGGCEKATFPAE